MFLMDERIERFKIIANLFLPFIRIFGLDIGLRILIARVFLLYVASDLPVQLIALFLELLEVHELQELFGNILQSFEIEKCYVRLYVQFFHVGTLAILMMPCITKVAVHLMPNGVVVGNESVHKLIRHISAIL